MSRIETNNEFLKEILTLQQDGKQAISAPTNWTSQKPLLEVDTDIDSDINRLCNSMLNDGGKNNTARWHFIIGSPGNGKSAALGRLYRNLVDKHSCRMLDESKTAIGDLEPTDVPYALFVYEENEPYASAMIVQDASVVRNPYEPNVDPANDLVFTLEEAWDKGISLVVCTNRGVIEKAVRDRYLNQEINSKSWFKVLKNIIDNKMSVQEWTFDSQKSVFENTEVTHRYLDSKSLLVSDDVFDRIVQKATESSKWAICTSCEVSALCPFKSNRDWLANENARATFFQILSRAEVLSGQVIVLREALAFLSLILAGCPRDYGNSHPCQWVRDKARSDDIFALAMRRIYMSVFASFTTYGLEVETKLSVQQKESLGLLNELAKESNHETSRTLSHVVYNSSPPSTDVGVGRMTGFNGILAEIDPWHESLPQAFIDAWDSDYSATAECVHPFFTEIEKRCNQTWMKLEELIEFTTSHDAPRCYWALRRWSSNFLIHFGGLLEGRSYWGKELDEFIRVLETIFKDPSKRTTEEKRRISELDRQLEELLATSEADYSDNAEVVRLSDYVTLSGRWVSENLRPRIDVSKKPESISLTIKFDVGETASLGAQAFPWLSKHLHGKLDTRCFPRELLRGVLDARIRAAAKGNKSYAFADNDVRLTISDGDGGEYTLSRIDGDVDIESSS